MENNRVGEQGLVFPLTFHLIGKEAVEATIPEQALSLLPQKVFITYLGRNIYTAHGYLMSLRIFSESDWDQLTGGLNLHMEPENEDDRTYLRFAVDNAEQCDLSSGAFVLPVHFASSTSISEHAQLVLENGIWYLDPDIPTEAVESAELKQWLTVADRDRDVFLFEGRAQELIKNYHAVIADYINALSSATQRQRNQYMEEIYETLHYMAFNDDAASIETVFQLCPNINRNGYHGDYSPLSTAIAKNAFHAVDALLRNGMDFKHCDLRQDNTAFELALEYHTDDLTSKEMMLYIVERGAEVSLPDVVNLYLMEEDEAFLKDLTVKAFTSGCLKDEKVSDWLFEWNGIVAEEQFSTSYLVSLSGVEKARIADFPLFLIECMKAVQEQNGHNSEESEETVRALLQETFLKNAEDAVELLRPQVEYCRSEIEYFSSCFKTGDAVFHSKYGIGTVEQQKQGVLTIRMQNGDRHRIRIVDSLLYGRLITEDAAIQKRLYFSKEVLLRAPGAEHLLAEATDRVAQLRTEQVPMAELMSMRTFWT